jgi:hypothetical protein
MKASLRTIVVVVTLFLASSLGIDGIHAQSTPGAEYFAQYGHYVRGEFLEKYNSVPNSRELFGLPISVAFISPSNGKLVQYFEKVRFELGVNSSVQISNMGKLVRDAIQPNPELENSGGCQEFQETGFEVCNAFLEFFNANGGVAQFGFPISNIERRSDGQLVQYFQKALLEHRAGLPPGKRIVVADLGRIAFNQIHEDPTMLAAERDDGKIDNIVSLKVRAYPKNAVMPRSGNQTIYVIVQDQRLLPVFGATVELKYTMPTGEVQRVKIPGKTNENGVIQYTFAYSTQSLGLAKVEVLVRLGEKLLGWTITSFRIWW